MALIDFYVRNQKLSKIGPKLVSDSINYVNCSFTFKTDDWNGIDKWVVFSKGEESYRVNLIDDAIPKEAGLNLGAGLWNVSLFGENPEGTERITTNSVTVEVAKSTIQDGEPLPPIALTEAEQIAAKAQRALDAANEVKSKAENGDFNGKPGEPGKDGENATPEQIAEAVENYFEENPIPGGGSGGEVTAESIKNALGYPPAKPSDIPTKTSQLENDEEFVDEERLKQYAQPKDDYALKSELPTVPTKVSAFENDADYAKKSELPTKTSDLDNDSGFITAGDIPAPPEVPVKSVFGRTGNVTAQKGDYTAEMVGADKEGKAVEEVGKHNVSENAHNDIRVKLSELQADIEAFLNINDEEFDQLSELIEKIRENAGSITELTNGKVNVSDIVNNLTTNVANKPLSAAQGVVLKGLVDSLDTLATGAKNTADEAKTAADNASSKVNNLESRMDSGEFKGDTYELTEADKVEIAGMVGSPVLPKYWEEYLPTKIAAIKAVQDEAGKDGFSFVVIADPHYPQNLGKRSPAIAKRIMEDCNIRYALVLGDLQSRAPWNTKALAESDFAGVEEMFKPIKENVLFQKGNHDGSWGNVLNGVSYPYNFTPEEMFNRIFAPTYRHHNAVTDESGTGYYIDDTANKVRYIMLNTHCNEYAENDDGSAKYNNMSHARFTQSQYDLVIEALSTMPEGWAVLCAAHVPINNTYGEAFGDSTNKTGDHIIMRNLLKAYKDKTAYSAEWAGTAGGGTSGGYTNLFSTSGSGFDNQSTKFYTNWLPYNGNDNGGNGTIYHFKGIATGQPYKMNFATDANGANATSQFYCTAASKQPPTAADYDSSVIIVQHHTPEYTHVRFEIRQALPENLIITANEPIIEATGGDEGYDTVSINADFSSAKGEMIGYFSGHTHADYVYDAANWWGVSIITTRCDSANENDSTLLAQRVEGTVTEQSFDVFTVNRKTGKLYGTKIGAGSDREINY